MPINRTPIANTEPETHPKERGTREAASQPFFVTEPWNTLDDVILPDTVKTEIAQFITLAKHRKLIFEEWGLSAVIKRYNFSLNLYGESGTGKTMTAHAIAAALGQKLAIVNYAEIESKYVGETSKNLVSFFNFAKEAGAVILFDEADALLSRRVTAMHSAADVSVNQTRNVLLKILDSYDGIVIFTTNFIQNFDSAFMRRIFMHVKFELPDTDLRKHLWAHYLVPTLPVTDREAVIDRISEQENLTGADISTAVLKAAVAAANSEEKRINVEMLVKAVDHIQVSKSSVAGPYEVTTRRVTEEYALSKINGGCIDGTHQ